jgi:hypothetical protein
VVQQLLWAGFYVNLDFHSIGYHDTLVTGNTPFSTLDDYTIYDADGWVDLWCARRACMAALWALLHARLELKSKLTCSCMTHEMYARAGSATAVCMHMCMQTIMLPHHM